MKNISQKVYIRAHQHKVYETLTSAEGWDAWFTTGTSLEVNQEGTGEIKLRWNRSDGSIIEDGGRIVESHPPANFTFQWKPGESITAVKITLEGFKDGTLVSLNEEGYGSSEQDLSALVGCSAGWGEALVLLKMYLEHGIVCKKDLLL